MRIRYGKPIKVRSLLGTFNLTGQGTTTGGFMVSSNEGHFKYQASVSNLRKFGIFNGHKYFLCAKSEFALDSFVFMSSSSWYQELYKSTTPTYTDNYSYVNIENVSADNSNIAVLVWCKNHASWEVYNGIVIDLTESFGSGKEPTAQQFYNKYNKYFSLIATGEEITIDDKAGQIAYKNLEEDSIRCKIAGGSSDIYYGYNQKISNGQFENGTSDWVKLESNISIVDGKLRCEPYTYKSLCGFKQDNFKGIVGHKYYIDVQGIDLSNIVNDNTTQIHFSINAANATFIYRTTDLSITNWNTIYECPNVNPTYLTLFRIYLTFNNGTHSGYFDIGSVSIIDLTDWFGAGKEPSTVAEFKEKFSKEYYGFCPTPIKLTKYQIEALPSYGYNQLQVNGMDNYRTFASEQGKATRTYDSQTNTLMLNFTDSYSTGQFYYNNSSAPFKEGDKGLFICQAKSNKVIQVGVFYAYTPSYQRTNDSVANEWSELYKFGTFQSGYSGINPYWYVYSSSNFASGDYVYVRNFMLINLTDWYGSGNEPTTIEEFKTTFPNKYYPYSKKRLLNKYMINMLKN